MKTVWFYPTRGWCLAKEYSNQGAYPISVPEDVHGLIEEWGNSSITTDPLISGILADLIEDRVNPTPETTEFVARLRYIFTNRTWMGFK